MTKYRAERRGCRLNTKIVAIVLRCDKWRLLCWLIAHFYIAEDADRQTQ